MNDLLKMGIVLMIITSVAALSLSVTYKIVSPKIDEQKVATINDALKEVMPDADSFEEEGEEFIAYKNKEKIGSVVIAKGQGYSSTIETIVGIDNDNKIVGIKVLSQAETPGLGTKIEEINPGEDMPWFLKQFVGKTGEDILLSKDGGTIDGITGATISSRAVTSSVRTSINYNGETKATEWT